MIRPSDKSFHVSRRRLLRGSFELVAGGRGHIGSTVYGTLIVLTSLTAAYAAEKHHAWKLVELVATAVLVFWIAFVYAQALSESIDEKTRVNRVILTRIANRELGLLASALLPILALLLGAVGLISESTSGPVLGTRDTLIVETEVAITILGLLLVFLPMFLDLLTRGDATATLNSPRMLVVVVAWSVPGLIVLAGLDATFGLLALWGHHGVVRPTALLLVVLTGLLAVLAVLAVKLRAA